MQGLTAARRREAFERSNKHCHICGGWVTLEDCQIDHIWPVDDGGTNELDNLLPSHPVCNHLKWHNDPVTVQRMLFLGMLANSHGYIDLTPFGQNVRAQRAERLRENWQRRKLADLKKSERLVDPRRVATIKSNARSMCDEFIAFEAEVVKKVASIRAARTAKAKKARAQDSGNRTKPARNSKRDDWDDALKATLTSSGIPENYRKAYLEFARMERLTPDE